MANQSGSGQGNFQLDNITYDLITILHEKSKGLEAYDKYVRDFGNDQDLRQILDRIRDDDQQHVQQLQDRLAQRLVDQRGRRAA